MFVLKFLPYILFIYPIIIFSQTFEGKITRVVEGDILEFQTSDSLYTIHLYGIDAPEKGQYFCNKTIDYLERYLWAEARIQIKKDPNQKGIFVLLYIRGTNVNKELVKNGYAWYDRLHCVNADLARAEEHAREKKLGLWKKGNAVSPWNFRKGVLAKPPPTDGKVKVLICADSDDNHYHKNYCQELKSCHGNVIVIQRKQAKDIHMKPCKYCYKRNTHYKLFIFPSSFISANN